MAAAEKFAMGAGEATIRAGRRSGSVIAGQYWRSKKAGRD